MNITEIVNPKCHPEKPKAIISKNVKRDFKSFKTVRDLASFSRNHFHFVYTQASDFGTSRVIETCEKLYVGSHLLWIDLDFDVDVNNLKKRFKKSNLRGFFYYSSSFYSTGEHRVRICVITKELVAIDGQAQYYARQFLSKLGYDDGFINGLDQRIYNATAYFAPVMESDGTLVIDHDRGGKSLFIFKGERFKWITQETFQKKYRKPSKLKDLKKQAQFGSYGDFARKLSKMENVQQALARPNGTITIIFKNIPEKTKGGYYINPEENPWAIFHPNKEKQPFYINTKLGQKDFNKYRRYVLNQFKTPDALKDMTTPDQEINDDNPYLESSVFKRDARFLLIESPTGSGKTTQLAKWMKSYEGSVLFISVNRAQAITTHKSLLKNGVKDVECYITTEPHQKKTKDGNRYYASTFTDNVRTGHVPERLICGVLSLHHLIREDGGLLRRYDAVVIDEITTLPRFAVSPVDLIADEYLRFEKDMEALTLLLRASDKIIGMDGYIAQPIIDAFTEISQKKPFLIRKNVTTKKKVRIYLTERGNEPNIKETPSCELFWSGLEKDIQKANDQGRFMVIAASYKRKASEITNYIKHVVPKTKRRIKLITGDSVDNEGALETIRQLDANLNGKVLFLIYSPAITTGVDISQAANTNVYHIINGKQLTSHTHYQMTMRGRKAKTYKVLCPTFLAQKPSKSQFSPESQFNEGIRNLMANLRLNTSSIQILKPAIKRFGLMMGSLLTFRYLGNGTAARPPYKTEARILEKLKSNRLKDLVKSDGVKTAIALEKAAIAWDHYDQEFGTLGQYINLLAREGCLVSLQLDTRPKTKAVPSQDDQDLVRKYRDVITNTLNYHGPIKNASKSGLNNTIKRISTGQRILNYLFRNYRLSHGTVKTANILSEALKTAKISLTDDVQKTTNDALIKVYNNLVAKVYSTDHSNIEPELKKLINNGMKVTDRSKVIRATNILRLIFHVYRENKNKDELTLKLNQHLLKSIEGMTESHIKYLYIK